MPDIFTTFDNQSGLTFHGMKLALMLNDVNTSTFRAPLGGMSFALCESGQTNKVARQKGPLARWHWISSFKLSGLESIA